MSICLHKFNFSRSKSFPLDTKAFLVGEEKVCGNYARMYTQTSAFPSPYQLDVNIPSGPTTPSTLRLGFQGKKWEMMSRRKQNSRWQEKGKLPLSSEDSENAFKRLLIAFVAQMRRELTQILLSPRFSLDSLLVNRNVCWQ
jgi:hypothetical protein